VIAVSERKQALYDAVRMRVLVLGVDWHGDVAPGLCKGFRALGIDADARYLLTQRRRGLRPRIEDELRATARFGPPIRRLHERRILEATRSAVASVAPTLTVCLSPELMPAAAVEVAAADSMVAWWFADDPLSFARRGLAGPPPVLGRIAEHGDRSFVAHPAWARGALAGARYLPYAARFEPDRPAYATAERRRRCVVVGSPRPERVELLAGIVAALGDAIDVWGWGPRGRLPTNSTTRPFRRSLRGWRVLGPDEAAAVYRSASLVLNLQDRQMIGAWNPQTFDLMALGVPQVVWNRRPVDYLEHPPPFASSVDGLVELARGSMDNPLAVDGLRDAYEEARRRHRWRHRAEGIAAAAGAL
jgi:hypothetical protein